MTSLLLTKAAVPALAATVVLHTQPHAPTVAEIIVIERAERLRRR